MMTSLFQLVLGGVVMWGSCQRELQFGKRGQGGPVTPEARVILFITGTVVAIDGIIKLFGGPGIDVPL